MEDVVFSYDGTRLLEGINLVIPQGTTTAIVGPSGSGKTTLCSLIARFWDVQEGRVLFGGRDVREYTCCATSAWCFRTYTCLRTPS